MLCGLSSTARVPKRSPGGLHEPRESLRGHSATPGRPQRGAQEPSGVPRSILEAPGAPRSPMGPPGAPLETSRPSPTVLRHRVFGPHRCLEVYYSRDSRHIGRCMFTSCSDDLTAMFSLNRVAGRSALRGRLYSRPTACIAHSPGSQAQNL